MNDLEILEAMIKKWEWRGDNPTTKNDERKATIKSLVAELRAAHASLTCLEKNSPKDGTK